MTSFSKRKSCTEEFCRSVGFPAEDEKNLTDAFARIEVNPAAAALFEKHVGLYEKNAELDYEQVLSEVEALGEPTGLSPYTLHLLLLILMTPHLHARYRAAGISEDIFHDTVSDLKWKLAECKRMYGITGTFVAPWHTRIFQMKLFALGRLQFETVSFKKDFSVGPYAVSAGQIVLNVHIPACGALEREACLASYALAESFFAGQYLKDRPLVFQCDSWLLFPEHRVMLPETSNIRRFAEDYAIVEARYSAPGVRPWPLFYQKKSAPATELPRNTMLERLYAERYEKGLPSGGALGVIFYQNGRILNTRKENMA